MLRLKDWREVVFEDCPKTRIEITQRTVDRAKQYKGQVRKPYNSNEYEAKRKRMLDTPLH